MKEDLTWKMQKSSVSLNFVWHVNLWESLKKKSLVMAKLRYSWNKVVAGDIISFNYNKKRRTVLVINPKYVNTKVR